MAAGDSFPVFFAPNFGQSPHLIRRTCTLYSFAIFFHFFSLNLNFIVNILNSLCLQYYKIRKRPKECLLPVLNGSFFSSRLPPFGVTHRLPRRLSWILTQLGKFSCFRRGGGLITHTLGAERPGGRTGNRIRRGMRACFSYFNTGLVLFNPPPPPFPIEIRLFFPPISTTFGSFLKFLASKRAPAAHGTDCRPQWTKNFDHTILPPKKK